jgi:hypothetical protein
MKTRQPLILTAGIDERDLEPFNFLRRTHFPPDRNFLKAHLTMFTFCPASIRADHRRGHENTPSRRRRDIRNRKPGAPADPCSFAIGIQSLLGGQDMRKWQLHITVQNKVSRAAADGLFANVLFLVMEDRGHRVDVIAGRRLIRPLIETWDKPPRHIQCRQLKVPSPRRSTVATLGEVAIGPAIVEAHREQETQYEGNGQYLPLRHPQQAGAVGVGGISWIEWRFRP